MQSLAKGGVIITCPMCHLRLIEFIGSAPKVLWELNSTDPNTKKSGFYLEAINGLFTTNAVFDETQQLGSYGSITNNVVYNPKIITLDFFINKCIEVDYLLSFFTPSAKKYYLEFKINNSDYKWCEVSIYEGSYFGISTICKDYKGQLVLKVDNALMFASEQKVFEFNKKYVTRNAPFLETPKNNISQSIFFNDKFGIIENKGNIDNGFFCNIDFDGYVKNITITVENEVTKQKQTLKILQDFQNGDQLSMWTGGERPQPLSTLDFYRDPKFSHYEFNAFQIWLTRNKKMYNITETVDINFNTDLKLKVGLNNISFEAEQGGQNMAIQVIFNDGWR